MPGPSSFVASVGSDRRLFGNLA